MGRYLSPAEFRGSKREGSELHFRPIPCEASEEQVQWAIVSCQSSPLPVEALGPR